MTFFFAIFIIYDYLFSFCMHHSVLTVSNSLCTTFSPVVFKYVLTMQVFSDGLSEALVNSTGHNCSLLSQSFSHSLGSTLPSWVVSSTVSSGPPKMLPWVQRPSCPSCASLWWGGSHTELCCSACCVASSRLSWHYSD